MRFVFACAAVAFVAVACTNANNGSPHQPPHDEADARARAAEVQKPHAVVDAPIDLRFIDTMTEHHRQGIEMADLALQKAKHAELKQFAAKMKQDQTKDIGEMRAVRDKSFFNANVAVDHSLPGMASMPPMDPSQLAKASGDDFDRRFIDDMIAHHQGAVMMARDASARLSQQELRAMADRMSSGQAKEIEQLRAWRTSWYGR